MERKFPTYFRYWGKAGKPEGISKDRFHGLPFHSLDVAAVGWHLMYPDSPVCLKLSGSLQVEPEWLRKWFCFLLSLHDLGKFARSFQGLVSELSPNLVPSDKRLDYRIRHDSLGFALWQKYLASELNDLFSSEYKSAIGSWLEIVVGHHGHPPDKAVAKRGINCFLEEDKHAAAEFVRDAYSLFNPRLDFLCHINPEDFKSLSWQLAGLAVLADWLGSDSARFPYHASPMALAEYWNDVALPKARGVLDYSFLRPVEIEPFVNIQQQFDFIDSPTPLQKLAADTPLGDGPQMLILEDVTGAGKLRRHGALSSPDVEGPGGRALCGTSHHGHLQRHV